MKDQKSWTKKLGTTHRYKQVVVPKTTTFNPDLILLKFYVSSLEHINSISGPLKTLVNTFTSWSFDLTNSVQIFFNNIFFQINNNQSLCLVLSWNIGLDIMCKVLVITNVKLFKELFHPYKITSKRRHYPTFCFSSWSGYYIIFLTSPRNNISSK